MTTSVAVVGATGTMGRLVSALIQDSPDFELVAGLDSSSDLNEMLAAEIVVDFTLPAETERVVDFAVTHGRNVLVGTSGWSLDRIAGLHGRIADASARGDTPGGVIIVPNFSIGSVLATNLSMIAGRFFDSVEIVETHHPRKVDSPSGTATRTAELVAEARADLAPVQSPHPDQVARGELVAGILVHSRRIAGVLASQEVTFGGTGETVTIRHDTNSPTSYDAGILAGLRATRQATGVTVGLDKLIDLRAALTRAAELTGGSTLTDGSA